MECGLTVIECLRIAARGIVKTVRREKKIEGFAHFSQYRDEAKKRLTGLVVLKEIVIMQSKSNNAHIDKIGSSDIPPQYVRRDVSKYTTQMPVPPPGQRPAIPPAHPQWSPCGPYGCPSPATIPEVIKFRSSRFGVGHILNTAFLVVCLGMSICLMTQGFHKGFYFEASCYVIGTVFFFFGLRFEIQAFRRSRDHKVALCIGPDYIEARLLNPETLSKGIIDTNMYRIQSEWISKFRIASLHICNSKGRYSCYVSKVMPSVSLPSDIPCIIEDGCTYIAIDASSIEAKAKYVLPALNRAIRPPNPTK